MDQPQNEVAQNYHSVLKKLAGQFDPVIQSIQSAESRKTAKRSWVAVLIFLPLSDMGKLIKVFKSLKNVNLSSIPLGGCIVIPGITGLLSDFKIPALLLTAIVTFIVLYASILPLYLKQLISFDHTNFHLKAYIRFRRQEYSLFEHAFLRDDFLFHGLYDFVNGVLTYKQNDTEIVKHITDQYNKEKIQLHDENKKMKEELKKELDEAIQDYTDYIEDIEHELADTEQILQYLIEMIGDINVLLYRMNNKSINYKDLTRLLSGITIYKQTDRNLELIADEGTTGASPSILELDDDKFSHWAAVIAAKEEATEPISNEPRPGYYVVSYRMKMGVIDSEIWFLNLHINKRLNQKAWYLALNDDIIENNEVYRLLHAFCLLIYNQRSKGAVQNEDTKTG